jgi:hypothetical protein
MISAKELQSILNIRNDPTDDFFVTKKVGNTSVQMNQSKIERLFKMPPHLGSMFENSVYIDQSKVDVNGIGIFASRNIPSGEIVTFYPSHYAVFNTGMKDWRIIMTSPWIENKQLVYSDDYRLSYAFDVEKEYSIVGHPDLIQYPNFIGHIVNDGARGHFTYHNHQDEYFYNIVSLEKRNVKFQTFTSSNFILVGIVSTKDIKKDEELLVSYGYEYWMQQCLMNELHMSGYQRRRK